MRASADLEQRTRTAIERLKAHEPPEGYWLAFSGGKDSTVVKALADLAGVRYEAHFNLTSVDPPELVSYIKTHHADVTFTRPKRSMFQLIEQKHYPPTRVIRYCCELLKERTVGGRVVLTGVRWEESIKRANDRRMVEACKLGGTKVYVNPIIDWTAADVWAFIHSLGIPYCSLYDEGFERVGCIMCPIAGTKKMQREAERWPRFANAYRIAFARMLEARTAAGKQNMWADADEVMQWWIDPPLKPRGSGRGQRVCEVCGADYAYTWTGQRTCGRTCGLILRDGPKPTQASLFD